MGRGRSSRWRSVSMVAGSVAGLRLSVKRVCPAVVLVYAFLLWGLVGGLVQPAYGQDAASHYDDIPNCEESYRYDRDCDEYVHGPAIESLRADGILAGTECAPRSFCPDVGASRWQMAVWLVRIVDGTNPVGTISSFDDVDEARWWAALCGAPG